jgi:2-hydroxychromene-2-carboxylate isomerase
MGVAYNASMIAEPIYHYFDYKSPYAFLAQEDTLLLESQHGLRVKWCPYTLDIPSYLGNAALNEGGEDVVGTRNAHQWRRVRYSYMDCRREANRRGLTIRGPKKIFDSSVAHMGFLYVAKQGDFGPYHNLVFTRFWRRELDIEDRNALQALMLETGYDPQGFEQYCLTMGGLELGEVQKLAEDKGVFGVPSYVYRNELYWGLERLPRLLEAVAADGQ